MFWRRRATGAQAQQGDDGALSAQTEAGDARPCDEQSPPGDGTLTLSTSCDCGHPRKDHRGLRMEVCGACLECECEEFRPADDTLGTLRGMLARVERLQETAASLRGRLNNGGAPHPAASSDGPDAQPRRAEAPRDRPLPRR